MDTNIKNYSTQELIELIELPKKKTYTLDEVHERVSKCMKQVNKVNEPSSSKNQLHSFLISVFKQICDAQTIHYDTIHINDLENYIVQETSNTILPEMNMATVVNADSHPVNIHNTLESKNTYVVRHQQGTINPLTKQTIQRVLNLNTRFRNNYFNTTSTDFIYNLPLELKQVVSMKVIGVEIPDCVYTISSKLGTNEFTIQTYDVSGAGTVSPEYLNETEHVIKIRDGKYTGAQLQDYLNTFIFSGNSTSSGDSSLNRVACEMDPISCKFRFFYDARADASGGAGDFGDGNIEKRFNIDFRLQEDKNRPVQLNMGWLLGYKQPYYEWTKNYVPTNQTSYDRFEGYNPESTFDEVGSKYFLIAVDDYNNNYAPSLLSPYQQGIMKDEGVLAKIPNMVSDNNRLLQNHISDMNEPRKYFGPVNIEKLRIRLLDEFGRVVDLNNADYAITLSIETIYE